MTAEDYELAADAITAGADSIALSADDPRDVTALRRSLPYPGDENVPQMVAKIDNARALQRIDAIAQAADVLLIEPDDLSREVGMSRLLEVQQDIARAARENNKPIFVGEMLESMRFAEQPTAADALNLAYAVAQDGLSPMLSDATRFGRNPVAAVTTAREIGDRAVAVGGGVNPRAPETPAEIIATLEAWQPGSRPRDQTSDQDRIAQLFTAGADTVMFDVANLHQDTAIAQQQLSQGMELAEDAGPVKRVVNLDGPRVRIGTMPPGGSRVEAGASLVLDAAMTGSELGDASRIAVPTVRGYTPLVEDVHAGDVLRIGDGPKLEVAYIEGNRIHARVLEGGLLNSAAGVRLVGDREFSGSPLTRREIDLLRIAEQGQADAAVVTVPGSYEVKQVPDLIQCNADRASLVARIENGREAQQIEGILEEFDAVVIDREALMQEVGAAELMPTQQRILDAATAAGKKVYLDGALGQMATVFGDRPTVAEAMEVAYGRQRGARGFILPPRTLADRALGGSHRGRPNAGRYCGERSVGSPRAADDRDCVAADALEFASE